MIASLLLLPVWLAADAPTVDQIVKRSLERERRNVRALDNYTFEQAETERTYDASGKVKKTETSVREVLQIDGSRYEKLIEENGKPLSADKARREQEKMDKEMAKRKAESQSAKEKRLREEQKRREEERKLRDEVAEAYTFTLEGVENVNGFPCWRVAAEPKAGFKGHTRVGKMLLPKMRGKLWIDQGTYEWLRVEAETTDKITFGGFLASLDKGATFRIVQMRVNNELWAPQRLEARINARGLMVKFRAGQEIEFRNYRKFTTESRIVAAEEATEVK